MKAITNLVRLTTAMVVSVLIFSCSDGEDGAIGPQGSQGEQGLQGDQGDQGEPGTANVIYSDWIPAAFDEEVTDGFDGFNIDDPEITQEIKDTGVVLVFGRQSSTVYQIPLTLNGSINESYYFRLIGEGTLNISVEGANGINNIGAPFLEEFRYVIIPGGVARSAIDYQNMSYEEIVVFFNIK